VDSTIIGAVIGAIAAIVAAFITVISKKREREKREELEREAQSASKSLSKAQREKYGFFADALITKIEFTDLEPNCVTTREWRGLRVGEHTAIAAIPGFFSISSGEFTRRPAIIAKNADFPKAIAMRHIRESQQSIEYSLEIAGMMTTHDPKLDCTVQVAHRGAFLMSREEVDQAYPTGFRNEYQRIYVEIPLDELRLEVMFPVGYNAETFPVAFVGRSEVTADLELHRIRSGFQRTERGAQLRIEEPLLGYSYAIYWVSPAKAAVAAKSTN